MGLQSGHEFLLDSREKSQIQGMVKQKNIPHRITALNTDFVLRRLSKPAEDIVGIERKAINDFVQSIQSGRIFDQAKKLRSNYPICYLMISGNLGHLEQQFLGMHMKINRNVIWGAISSLVVRERINVLWLSDDDALIECAYRICCKVSEGKFGNERLMAAKYSLYDPVKVLMNHIPGLTAKKTRDMLKKFGSLKGVVLADEQQLMSVEGVGRETASLIVKLFEKKFDV